jgi:hypothetical protein
MLLWKQQALFAKDVAQLILYIANQGYSCTFGEVFRTYEQALLNQKRGIGIKNSLHTKKMAVDLNIFSPEGVYLTKVDDYIQFGTYWENLDSNNRWGGSFKKLRDGNHFERLPLES